MARNIKKQVLLEKDISYLNRDFASFRAELVDYARVNYGDKIQDFSEAGLGGVFVDMAAYVGDVMSFYLDHQFNELNLETAIEDRNIARLVRTAGVKATPKSPAIALVNVSVKIPSVLREGQYQPDIDLLPTIKSGTIFASSAGVDFELYSDIDFSELTDDYEIDAVTTIFKSDSNGTPLSFLLTKEAFCTSAKSVVETHVLGDTFVPFRKVTLKNPDISEIIFVKDSDRNEYYEVDNLMQDTVYKRIMNNFADKNLVKERIELIPASRRFVKEYNRNSGKTYIRFGSGKSDTYDDDIIPDPSDCALPLYGDRKTFNNVTIDPNDFLGTQTLGISPRNTTITVSYRHGGGLDNNVPPGSIHSVSRLNMVFKTTPSAANIVGIRGSVQVNNPMAAAGGENEPTIDELRSVALNYKNAQNRMVTREDVIARIYTLPNNFGRVFRAAIVDNPNNPLAVRLFIISRDTKGNLTIAPDTLKDNLSTYLNRYRLISEALDILDAPVANIGLKYSVVVEKGYNYETVLNKINFNLTKYLKVENYQINQPIIIADLTNLILNTEGVISLVEFEFMGFNGVVGNNTYSIFIFDPTAYMSRGMLFPPPGGIFEVKFPNDDISGRAI